MSDISNTDEPFEVRDAGEGKGLGCFATRDIKPGEIVLVDYTPIHGVALSNWDKKVNNVVTIYEALDEDEKQEWDSLHSYYRPTIAKRYTEILAQQRQDGSFFTETKRQHYLNLLLAFDVNNFDSGDEGSALFLKASVFETRERRQRKARKGWGFDCVCARCAAGVDTYTASLIQAREAANAFEPKKTEPPPIYPDDIDGMATRIKLRAERDLERLAEAGTFHRDYFLYWAQSSDAEDDEEAPGEAKRHALLDRQYCNEALKWAENVWPVTHEILIMLRKAVRQCQVLWDSFYPPGYLPDPYGDEEGDEEGYESGDTDDFVFNS